ncbi:hypothetical protein [Rhodococcus sp. UNC23MFCrub1.1]|uniref:hypothetical protein n=1 Tax=Rhodococcus sp. UNC23MFCrub1.1 TaxID=1449068 RepID=UPI000486361F|nr:hypothetical protein [Rhodococcus sp. UNC23MFCrub1.1]
MTVVTSDELVDRIRTRHHRILDKLRVRALGERGTPEGIRRTTGIPPHAAARSFLDPTLEVTVFASHMSLGVDPTIGAYPTGSVLVLVSVSAHHVRTRATRLLPEQELDAWGRVLGPVGYEDYTLRLGRVLSSPSTATHYRHVLGPDGYVCAIDPRHEHAMRAATTYS